MSLDKAIEHGKEHRKPYRGGKAIDNTCRNHGGCPACLNNRMRKYIRRMDKQQSDFEDFVKELSERAGKRDKE